MNQVGNSQGYYFQDLCLFLSCVLIFSKKSLCFEIYRLIGMRDRGLRREIMWPVKKN